jgi:hypothetical protein
VLILDMKIKLNYFLIELRSFVMFLCLAVARQKGI